MFIGGLLAAPHDAAQVWDALFRGSPPALKIAAVTNVADFKSDAPYVPLFFLPGPGYGPVRPIPAPPDVGAPINEALGASPLGNRWSWAHHLGALDAGNTLVQVVFTRTGPAPTEVDGMAVVDRNCSSEPSAGTLLSYQWPLVARRLAAIDEGQVPPGGRNYFLAHIDGLPGHMGISLTDPTFTQPQLMYVGSRGKVGATPFPQSISLGQETSVEVLGTVWGSDCKWRLRIFWRSENHEFTTDVPAGGGYFETTGAPFAPEETRGLPVRQIRIWSPETQEWEAANERNWGYSLGSRALLETHCEKIALPENNGKIVPMETCY